MIPGQASAPTSAPAPAPTPTAPPVTQSANLEREKTIIAKGFPTSRDENVRIHHLWGPYWRVNIHDTTQGNYITKSAFVKLTGNNVQIIEGVCFEEKLRVVLGLVEDKPRKIKLDGDQKTSTVGAHRFDPGVKFVQMRFDGQFLNKATHNKLAP
jgi:hypothetical protein